jgi:hypothetical protein
MTGTNTGRDTEMKVQTLEYYPCFRVVSIDPSSRLQRSWRKKNISIRVFLAENKTKKAMNRQHLRAKGTIAIIMGYLYGCTF